MTDTIVHRGPDDAGFYAAPGIGFGFRRLSIIDVSGGHQPLCNEDETVWVMLNGEIYNYPELRNDLLRRNHIFRTHSDTETIVHLYEEYGEDCFRRLRGMFAIALWDSRQRKLLLARDRVGKKPLFFWSSREQTVFGSELKCLLAAGMPAREIDHQALSDYFSFGYIPAPKTIYRNVRKLLPGHYLAVTPEETKEKSFWTLSFGEIEERSENEWCEAIRHSLCEATRIRLMSDVPLGAFLSGGVDSSSIVATMSSLMNRPVTTCSVGFKEQEYNEADCARELARKFGADHHEQTVEPNAIEVLCKLAWHYDEPFADSSAIPTYYVSSVARQFVTVALGGDGGDESFAGYRRYYFDQLENRLRAHFPRRFSRRVFGPLGRIYPPLAWAPRIFRARSTLQSLAREPLEGYFNSISIFRSDEKSRLWTGDFRRSLGNYDSLGVLEPHYYAAGTGDLLSRIQYVDIKTYLPDDILAKVDRASMAVSLEVRAPLLDHVLLELAARIPSRLKLRGSSGKYIFKKAVADILPAETLNRRKQGFAVPLARWFRKELYDFAHELLFSGKDDVLDQDYLKKLWKQHQSGTHDRSAHLWAVLMYRQWRAVFEI